MARAGAGERPRKRNHQGSEGEQPQGACGYVPEAHAPRAPDRQDNEQHRHCDECEPCGLRELRHGFGSRSTRPTPAPAT